MSIKFLNPSVTFGTDVIVILYFLYLIAKTQIK